MSNIAISGVSVPIFVRLGDRARPFLADGPRPPVGSLRAIRIHGIVATGTGRIGCSITGLPGHEVEDVSVSDVTLETEGGGKLEQATREVPEKADAYPEGRMFGELPAYGFYVRHVRGLRLSDVRLKTAAPDARHAIVGDDVRDVSLVGLNAPAAPAAAALVRFTNVVDAVVRDSKTREPIATLLKLEGAATRDVRLFGDEQAGARVLVEASADVPAKAWRAK